MNWLVSSKFTWGIWRILIRALKNHEILHFHILPFTKVHHVSVKKVHRSYFWWHWILKQNVKENWIVLSKITLGIWQIFTTIFGLLWDSFLQHWKFMSLTFTGELGVMTMKNDAKIEEKLTCELKIKMRNLTSFDSSTQKSQKFALSWAAFDQIIEFLS